MRGTTWQRNSFEFFLSNASIIIFFNVTVELYRKTSKFEIFYIFFSLTYLSCSDEKIFLLFSSYYPATFMDKYSFTFYLFHSQSNEDADSDDDGADIPSVVLPAPATPAPLVTWAASLAPPAAPLVPEVSEILSGQYF